MNLPAVVHRPTPEYTYPRARDKLTIQISTAREDFRQVTLVYWPRYETSADKQLHIPCDRGYEGESEQIQDLRSAVHVSQEHRG